MQTLKDNIRAEILTEAGKEFSRFGYDKASMKIIAGNCGISVGSLYKYFSGKKELFDAVTAPGREALARLLQCSDSDSFSSIAHVNKSQLRLLLQEEDDRLWETLMASSLANTVAASSLSRKMLSQWFRCLLKEIITRRHTKAEINLIVSEYLSARNAINQNNNKTTIQ